MRGAVNEERRRDHYSGLVCVTVNYIVTFHQHFMLKLGESDLDILKHTHSHTHQNTPQHQHTHTLSHTHTHSHTRAHARALTHTHTRAERTHTLTHGIDTRSHLQKETE